MDLWWLKSSLISKPLPYFFFPSSLGEVQQSNTGFFEWKCNEEQMWDRNALTSSLTYDDWSRGVCKRPVCWWHISWTAPNCTMWKLDHLLTTLTRTFGSHMWLLPWFFLFVFFFKHNAVVVYEEYHWYPILKEMYIKWYLIKYVNYSIPKTSCCITANSKD